MVEVEYERGAVRVVNRRRGGRDDGGGGVQANTAVPARVCGCGCGYRLTTWTGRRWKSRQHSSGYELSRLSASIRISGVWCLGCRCRPVAKGRLKMRVECKTGPGRVDGPGRLGSWGAGVGAGMKDAGRPPPPARSLEWHSTPPQKQLPEHISAARIPTSLLATVLEARPFASFKGLTAASCIRIISTVSNRHFRSTPSFFSSQGTSVLRWSAPPRMHGARNTLRTAHGGSTERRGHCSKEPDETLSLSGPSPSPPPRSPGPGFPGQQQASLFFFSSHPSPGSLLFSSCLEKLVVGPDPTGFQAGIDRLLLPRAWTFPPCHALPPHAEREGIQGGCR